MTTYRIDYQPVSSPIKVEFFGTDRARAMRAARRASKAHGTAYAIATTDDQDTGQRVYADGYFSRQDDAF